MASPRLRDLNFSQTVVLLLDYSAQGAVGLIVNRPSEVSLSRLLPDLKGLQPEGAAVYVGGPVARRQMMLLVRSSGKVEGTRRVFGDVHVSRQRAVLERLIRQEESKSKFRVYVGHAGWGPGQLDREIARGDWRTLGADAETVFDKEAAEIWPDLLAATEERVAHSPPSAPASARGGRPGVFSRVMRLQQGGLAWPSALPTGS